VTDDLFQDTRVPLNLATKRLWAALRQALEVYPYIERIDVAAAKVSALLRAEGICTKDLDAALADFLARYAEETARTSADATRLAQETEQMHATAEGEPTYLKETTT
jgi:hypothetical protein